MQNLITQVENLKKSDIKATVDERIKEFEAAGEKKSDIFGELCFCLMTANFSAEKCIRIQRDLGQGFSFLPEDKLAEELKKHGHRFPNTRANYITEARKCETDLCNMMQPDGKKMREWLIENVKGLGMKEASHFLRNTGYKDVAIIDFHIIDLLSRETLIEKPKNITPKIYLEIEKVLEHLASKVNLNLAELDLYLWYLETGKVLK